MVREAENRDEIAAICAKRQWINCPVEDVTDRVKGKFDYGTGQVVENTPHIMRFWGDNASYPFQSHDLWFLTEDIRWGKYEAGYDTKALIAKVNREDLWREAAKDARRCRRRHPDLDLARQGDLLRRQGVRSGKSGRVSEVPVDQARRGLIQTGPRAGARGPLLEHGDTISMTMPAMKTEATAVALPTASRRLRRRRL